MDKKSSHRNNRNGWTSEMKRNHWTSELIMIIENKPLCRQWYKTGRFFFPQANQSSSLQGCWLVALLFKIKSSQKCLLFFISAPKKCGPDEFACSRGACLKKTWLCDDSLDCSDGSDEKNCSKLSCYCVLMQVSDQKSNGCFWSLLWKVLLQCSSCFS